MSEEILNIQEVCQLLGIKRRTMYTLLKEGRIPALKIGGQWRFHKEVIIDMFRDQARRSFLSIDGKEKRI